MLNHQGRADPPPKVYKKYADILLPLLLKVYNYTFQSGVLPASTNEVVVIVLLKPGKDALLPDSYRPISLLRTDVKLLARVLASRLAKVVHKPVHRDQLGFIPTRSTAQNLRRLFLNLQIPMNNPGNQAIFSLDAAKDFDTIEWPYLWAVLE